MAAKGLTAPLNLLIFLIIAARLPKPEFASYVWLLAFTKLSQQLSFVGVNWIALHQVPYYRAHIGGRAYRRFLLALVALYFALVAAAVGITLVAAPFLVGAFGHDEWLRPLRLYLFVMAAELAVEFLRPCIFEPLYEQGASQGNVLVQHSVFLAGLLLSLANGSELSIDNVIYARAVAVWVAAIAALVQLGYLLQQPTAVTSERPPSKRALLGFALDNYAQDIMRLTSSGPLMTILASRMLDVPTLAAFGFAQNLVGYVDRFLPAQLFLGLLRPRVIAAYGDDRSFSELRRRTALILKVSICALAAVAAVAIVAGPAALAMLAEGQYASTYGLLLTFLLWLAVVSVQRMQVILTNVLGRSEVLRRAALASLLVVPTAVVLIAFGAGAYGPVLGMIVGELVSVRLISNQLRRTGYHLNLDVRGYGRLAGAVVAAVIIGKLFVLSHLNGILSVGMEVAVTAVCFVFALRLFHAFASEERRAIENLLGRKLVLL